MGCTFLALARLGVTFFLAAGFFLALALFMPAHVVHGLRGRNLRVLFSPRVRLFWLALPCAWLAACLDFTDEPAGAGLPVSCKAIKDAARSSPDGEYEIDPDGDGPSAARSVFCDMTRQDGGWTLMRSRDVAAHEVYQATLTVSEAEDGGVIFRATPLTVSCDADPRAQLQVLFDPGFAWTQIRARHDYSGVASCWSLFGDREYAPELAPNVVPFDPDLDTIPMAVGMGGSLGDGYHGGNGFAEYNSRCDASPENFWGSFSSSPRWAVVIQRRDDLAAPAGLGTGAGCVFVSPDTHWTYSEIYVR
jgi:hypothetical protein